MFKYLRHLLLCGNRFMIHRFVFNKSKNDGVWYLECAKCLYKTKGINIGGRDVQMAMCMVPTPIKD